jgi:hypothetical protein
MAATLLGLAGSFGIAADQTGVIIESQSETTRSERKYLRTRQGERSGMAAYDDSVEFRITGAVPSATPFAGKINASFTASNAIALTHANGTGGSVVCYEVSTEANQEEFKTIEISGEALPYLTIA